MTFIPAGVFSRSANRSFARRRGVDWRVVALTAMSAVLFIAMLSRPA